jgi:hypothetical protein
MTIFALRIKADLENIETMSPLANNLWKLDIVSPDGVDQRLGITVSNSDVEKLEGSKGEANFIMKWKGSNSQSYIKIVDLKKTDSNYSSNDSGNWKLIIGFECRGLEPTKWIPGIDFNILTSSGKIFENVDLTEKDWAEYDEENDLSITVTNLEYEIVKIK